MGHRASKWYLPVLLLSFVVILSACSGGGNLTTKPKDTTDTYSVSGTVIDADTEQGIKDVNIALTGNTNRTTTTNDGGAWSFDNLTGQHTIKPALEGYEFVPAQINVSKSDAGPSTFTAKKTTDSGEPGGGTENPGGATPIDCTEPTPMAGTGTSDDPYVIVDVCQLQRMNEALDKHYELGNDIDASVTTTWTSDDDGKGFIPIGTDPYNFPDKEAFRGSFDGNNYTIDGLYIDQTELEGSPSTGLFGYTIGATIVNVGLTNVEIYGASSAGALVGYNLNSTIKNSYSTGAVTGDTGVGGLVGVNDISGISDSYSAATVTGTEDVGGLVGHHLDGFNNIRTSYSTGKVTGDKTVGGLVGMLTNSSIWNSYSMSEVSGQEKVGGLVGVMGTNGGIDRSYSTGKVTGTGDFVGGLLGRQEHGSVARSYWDEQTSEMDSSAGDSNRGARTTSAMQSKNNYLPAWDFDTVWKIAPNDYPDLQSNSRTK